MTTYHKFVPAHPTMRIITADGEEHIIERVVLIEDYHAEPEPQPPVTFHFVNCEKTPASIHRIQAVIEKCGSVRLQTWDGTEVVGVRYIPGDDPTYDDIMLDGGSSLIKRWFLDRWHDEGHHRSLVARTVHGFYEPNIDGVDGVFE